MDWEESENDGGRTVRSEDITFYPRFASPPQVLLTLAGVDAEAGVNLRLRVTQEDVQHEEFNIRVHTWDDSIIHGVMVSWLAHGE